MTPIRPPRGTLPGIALTLFLSLNCSKTEVSMKAGRNGSSEVRANTTAPAMKPPPPAAALSADL